uniref:Uncharacterized protein n=1 Tax=Arundo donax TaxID=35708 RepID=A0A0A9ALZ2_ARUDO
MAYCCTWCCFKTHNQLTKWFLVYVFLSGDSYPTSCAILE